ncbi:MAG: putative zinc-binding metallopeptidase [Gammaproteobacteria bacterium]|nr:putative zinc-binding metallopeptidase [Gammaproteobacteria bacterium]
MKRLLCGCGRAVYFDNHSCGNCSRALAFNPATLTMQSESEVGAGLPFCVKRDSASRCNWIAPAGGSCLSCRMSQVIPSLAKRANRGRWRKLEQAKRRLIYDLLRLGLPVEHPELNFVFKEDRRTNPNVGEDHVSIGHANGVITINAAEADDGYRETMRQQMNEPYRTLLGHFRHESGHHFFGVVVGPDRLAEARALFGDDSSGYDDALQRYYRDGPQPGWEKHFISSYASAHPAEDWAECWAHYLHICAVLEAADTTGLKTGLKVSNWQTEFIDLVIAVNEVLRSMGLADAYPFVITPHIASKIEFIHQTVAVFQPSTS